VASHKRVLILSASIGGGHVAAARALESAFGEEGNPCLHVDLLDYTSAPFRRIYRQSYFDLVRRAPEMVDWLGRRLDRAPGETMSRARRFRGRISRLISYQLPRVLRAYQPDLILHTHFLPPDLIPGRRSLDPLPPQAIVVTDFGAHALWMTPGVARYYVAAEEVAVHLRESGVASDKVEVTGIPIDLRFNDLPTVADARKQLGLDPEKDVLLMLLGGMDRKVAKALLERVHELRWPVNVLVVSGRSPELLDVARDAAEQHNELVRILPFGMRQDMPTLMASASLIVGKPGGLTVSEALAAGRPFAVVQPYPVQEEANAGYLLEQGVAIRIDPLTTFDSKVRSLLTDRKRLEDMSERAKSIGRPDAARAIVASARQMLLEKEANQPT